MVHRRIAKAKPFYCSLWVFLYIYIAIVYPNGINCWVDSAALCAAPISPDFFGLCQVPACFLILLYIVITFIRPRAPLRHENNGMSASAKFSSVNSSLNRNPPSVPGGFCLSARIACCLSGISIVRFSRYFLSPSTRQENIIFFLFAGFSVSVVLSIRFYWGGWHKEQLGNKLWMSAARYGMVLAISFGMNFFYARLSVAEDETFPPLNGGVAKWTMR